MSKPIYRLWHPDEFLKAGPSDLIELRPVPGFHPLFFELTQIAATINMFARRMAPPYLRIMWA